MRPSSLVLNRAETVNFREFPFGPNEATQSRKSPHHNDPPSLYYSLRRRRIGVRLRAAYPCVIHAVSRRWWMRFLLLNFILGCSPPLPTHTCDRTSTITDFFAITGGGKKNSERLNCVTRHPILVRVPFVWSKQFFLQIIFLFLQN